MLIKLSTNERLVLFNQYEILKNLSMDKHDKERYEYYQTILHNGFKHEYCELLQGMDNEIPENISEFVWEVFKLYRTLYNSYYELSDDEKLQIDKDDIKYEGFDGNEEGDYYSYANFILQDMKRFEDIYDNGKVSLNSHSNKVDQYSCMLAKWKEIRTGEYSLLGLDEIKSIVEWYK